MNKTEKFKYHELATLLERVQVLSTEITANMSRIERDIYRSISEENKTYVFSSEDVSPMSKLLRDMAPLTPEELKEYIALKNRYKVRRLQKRRQQEELK